MNVKKAEKLARQIDRAKLDEETLIAVMAATLGETLKNSRDPEAAADSFQRQLSAIVEA